MKHDLSARDSKSYWRSLERLLDSPALQADEFPPGASEAPQGVDRRTMLKIMGASFALAGLAGCRRPEEAIVPWVKAPENVIEGIPKRYATTMPWGTRAFGMLVESHEGRPTKVEGNELHPSSLGKGNVWMQAAVLDLFDPDRSRHPLARREGTLRKASWEDFLSAWVAIASDAAAREGQGLAVLGECFASPTMASLATEFRRRFPKALWVSWDPFSEENVLRGLQQLTDRPLRPLYHLEQARTIVSFDCDFLLSEGEVLPQSLGFTRGRRDPSGMNRLYVLESTPTVTGASADHRIPWRRSRMGAALLGLALSLRRLGLELELPQGADPALPASLASRLEWMARDLFASRTRALVLAGESQPPEVHALALALNQALGALGHTVSLVPARDLLCNPSDLPALVEAMRQGEIHSLILLGGNPLYNLPGSLDFAGALASVENVIQVSRYRDETTEKVTWHLPRSHFLESWGDARSADGSASITQPLIAPLFETRSDVEVLGLMVRDWHVKGYDMLREVWQHGILAADGFEEQWRRTLHDGIAAKTAPAPVEASWKPEALAGLIGPLVAQEEPAALEVTFHPSATLWDGRFANHAWLQELPDPITKLCWGDAARVSPETARRLQIESGQKLALELEGCRLEIPALVLPGQAPGSLALTLGHGRTAAGRVGSGVGVSAHQLRHPARPYAAAGLTVRPLEERVELTRTQEHWRMEGREPIREVALAEYLAHPGTTSSDRAEKPATLWAEHDYSKGHQWGMVIDLNACTGCSACVMACQSENNIPVVGAAQVRRSREMHWLRVDRYFSGEPEEPDIAFQPVPCMHCENAPCEEVCPVGATVHDRQGLNVMVYNRCIGTRYCSNNCPYKVRRFNFFNYTKDLPELVQMAMNPDVTIRSRGVMEKCSYCVQRINEARIQAGRQGRPELEAEVQTACQQTCPAEAIVFGDINDPGSAVSRARSDGRHYVLLEELDVRPRTSYLARLRNPNPEWEESE